MFDFSSSFTEKDIQLPWLVDAEKFERMLLHGTFISYEHCLCLGICVNKDELLVYIYANNCCKNIQVKYHWHPTFNENKKYQKKPVFVDVILFLT